MNVRFEDADLDRLEADPTFTAGKDQAIVKAFRERMHQIRSATDERVFYQAKSFHYEKLDGRRRGQRSIRLNKQYRLILWLEGEGPTKIVVIEGIEDYH